MFVCHYVCHGCRTLFVSYPTLRSTVRGSPLYSSFPFLSPVFTRLDLFYTHSCFRIISKH
jgi:LSD1 subclass zinc finger protein